MGLSAGRGSYEVAAGGAPIRRSQMVAAMHARGNTPGFPELSAPKHRPTHARAHASVHAHSHPLALTPETLGGRKARAQEMPAARRPGKPREGACGTGAPGGTYSEEGAR